jgi:hypothetical protein
VHPNPDFQQTYAFTLHFDPERIRIALEFELPPSTVAGRVGEIDDPTRAPLAAFYFPRPLAN